MREDMAVVEDGSGEVSCERGHGMAVVEVTEQDAVRRMAVVEVRRDAERTWQWLK